MSLFADGRYQWRETYFVLFDHKHRPKAADVKRLLAELGPRMEIHELAANDAGLLESMTVLSHADAAGMDITYVEGEEVKEQIVRAAAGMEGQADRRQGEAALCPGAARQRPLRRLSTSRRSATCPTKRTTARSTPARCCSFSTSSPASATAKPSTRKPASCSNSGDFLSAGSKPAPGESPPSLNFACLRTRRAYNPRRIVVPIVRSLLCHTLRGRLS